MKIKLSKSQWEEVGRKAGWVTAEQYCYDIKCHECGKKCSKEQIQKLMGHKICNECASKIGDSIT